MNAATCQRDFSASLLAPALPAPAGLRTDMRPSAERRFDVHRNNFVVTLVDALEASFPVTRALVGGEFFRAMAREYVLATPPRTPVLVEHAFDFPSFIARFDPAAAVPYLSDVARIEALRIRAYHALDAEPVDEFAFRQRLAVPGPLASIRLELHPACVWMRSSYAACSIWQAHQGLARHEDADLSAVDVAAGEDVLITRPGFDVHVALLPEGALELLESLGRGEPLGEAFEHAHSAAGKVDDAELFVVIMRYGLVTRFITSMEE